jgi:uncharacterized protein YbjT (DUF2867 family)
MNIIITGATGMVGEGVLIECLQNPLVKKVVIVNRRPSAIKHAKLQELIVPDFMQLDACKNSLSGYDACFYCAGTSSVGMNEEKYTQITYTTTLAFANKLAEWNTNMVFTFVSGASTDSSEKGKLMWARVKGKTENALIKLSFKGVYNFRPGIMKPFKEQQNVKPIYKPFIGLFSLLFSKQTLTMKQVGQAMINAVRTGYSKQVLEIQDIKELAG